jgi:hypothetical protein
MPWQVMHDGHEIALSYPRPDDLTIERIAHNLSMINRFVGSTSRPYSVAEHSLLVADILQRHFGLCPHGVFAGLFHDGHESVTGDQSSPSKKEIGPGWDMFEGKFEAIVSSHFRFRTAALRYAREIKTADLMALAIERAQLMPQHQPNGMPSTPWPCLARVPVLDGYDLNQAVPTNRTWRDWKQAFIDRAHELEEQRRQTYLNPHHLATQGA